MVFIQSYYLEPKFISQKSFWKKAVVVRYDEEIRLKSYETVVARIRNGKAIVENTYSNTTLKHIKEFLAQNGFKADNKAQILYDYSPSALHRATPL